MTSCSSGRSVSRMSGRPSFSRAGRADGPSRGGCCDSLASRCTAPRFGAACFPSSLPFRGFTHRAGCVSFSVFHCASAAPAALLSLPAGCNNCTCLIHVPVVAFIIQHDVALKFLQAFQPPRLRPKGGSKTLTCLIHVLVVAFPRRRLLSFLCRPCR